MKILKKLFLILAGLFALGIIAIAILYITIKPTLPDVTTLKDITLQQPLLIYTNDNKLIAEYGEDKRKIATYEEIPEQLKNAFIAAEDQRFYSHYGVDPFGLFRAIKVALFNRGTATQGASTITQQLARNMFLTSEKTVIRKLKEAILAIEIERHFSKEEIFTLYANKIFLGQRSYGVKAAAQTYFDKDLKDLTISESAIIAGIPKGPSTYNPIFSVKNTSKRRAYVLRRMLDEGFINQEQYQQALNEPITSKLHYTKVEFSSDYVAEQVRLEMVKKYGDDATKLGYKVYTTINSEHQLNAEKALRDNLLNYTKRHGFISPKLLIDKKNPTEQELFDALIEEDDAKPLIAGAIINGFNKNGITVLLKNGEKEDISIKNLSVAGGRKTLLTRGKLVWLIRNNQSELILTQLPKANSGLVSLDSRTGAIDAMVGGFSYDQSSFNRATQALVQVGSSIKPFIYSAAIDKGLSLSSLINDAPFTKIVSGKPWSPKNSPPTYSGLISVREGLGKSKNIVAIKVLETAGVDYTADYMTRFGFKSENIIPTESMALGTASFTPLEMARGYAVFENGGYLITPYLIDRITDSNGSEIYKAEPKVACTDNCDNIPLSFAKVDRTIKIDDESIKIKADQAKINNEKDSDEDLGSDDDSIDDNQISVVPEMQELSDLNQQSKDNNTTNPNNSFKNDVNSPYAPKVIDSGVAFLMRSALNSNIYGKGYWNGIAWRAKELNRKDIGGKTGTTNKSKIGWFVGYTGNIVSAIFVGFDDNKFNIGEAGAKVAQPAWISYMKSISKDIPLQNEENRIPSNIVVKKINPYTNTLGGNVSEYFIKGTEPTRVFIKEQGYDDGTGTGTEIF